MIISAAAIVLSINSCTKTEPDTKGNTVVDEKKENQPVISGLTTSEVILYPSEFGKSVTISFSTSDADTVFVSSGENLQTELSKLSPSSWKLSVTAKESFGAKASAVVHAKNSAGEVSQAVEFHKAYLEINPGSYQSAVAGASLIVSVSSNISYSASVDTASSSWLHSTSTTSGISVTIDRNTLFQEKTGTIIISDKDGLLKKSFTVTQEAAIDYCKKEREALIALYNATDGAHWKKMSSTLGDRDISTENWCTDKPINQWYGVEVGGDGHVMYVHLSDMNLSGTLPEEIGDLVYCQEFVVTSNKISGTLPTRIGEMQALKSFYAGGNNLSGNLASSTLSALASKLKIVSLAGNGFTGTFPEWIGDMPAQCNFWLQDNCLSGVVPQKVQNHAKWNSTAMDGTGRTIGQINMVQKEGYVLTLD